MGSQILREPQEGISRAQSGLMSPTSLGISAISHSAMAPVSTQPSGLPHHTPGLTGQHVLTVTSFTKEQVIMALPLAVLILVDESKFIFIVINMCFRIIPKCSKRCSDPKMVSVCD